MPENNLPGSRVQLATGSDGQPEALSLPAIPLSPTEEMRQVILSMGRAFQEQDPLAKSLLSRLEYQTNSDPQTLQREFVRVQARYEAWKKLQWLREFWHGKIHRFLFSNASLAGKLDEPTFSARFDREKLHALLSDLILKLEAKGQVVDLTDEQKAYLLTLPEILVGMESAERFRLKQFVYLGVDFIPPLTGDVISLIRRGIPELPWIGDRLNRFVDFVTKTRNPYPDISISVLLLLDVIETFVWETFVWGVAQSNIPAAVLQYLLKDRIRIRQALRIIEGENSRQNPTPPRQLP